MLLQVGTVAGYKLIKDTDDNQCYTLEDGVLVWYGDCPNVATGNTGLPPFITPGASSPGTGGYIQPGQSWLNDLLNWSLGLSAIGGGQTIQGGAINPQQQPIFNPSYQPTYQPPVVRSDSSSGIGAGLESFVKQNSTLLLIGLGVFLLYKSGRK